MKKAIMIILMLMMSIAIIAACGQRQNDAIKEEETENQEQLQVEEMGNVQKEYEVAERPTDNSAEDSFWDGGTGPVLRGEAYMTFILKEPSEEILLSGITNTLESDSLPVYIERRANGKSLREASDRYAEMVETIGEYEKEVVADQSDVYMFYLKVPGMETEYTGTTEDEIKNRVIAIRSLGRAITVGYPLPGCSNHVTDHVYITELIRTDPFLKAACEYAGIISPKLLFRHDYTTDDKYRQMGEYEIVDESPETGDGNLRCVYVFIGDNDSMSIIALDAGGFMEEGTYPVKDYEETLHNFCDTYDLTEEDILMTGFRYINAESSECYVPYYELLVPNQDLPLPDGFDPAEYGNYDLILLPAISR